MSCSRFLFTRFTLALVASTLLGTFATTTHAQNSNKPFEAKFWQFLIGNNYQNWAPAPGQDGDFYSGQVPHGALLKMYVNRTAASDVAGLKIGSVVVLENYRSDRSLKSISVMYRTEGFNSAANDWYWVEYNPDGSVVEDITTTPSNDEKGEVILASAKSTKLMGKAASCIACHGRAGGSDFAFFNDTDDSNVAGRGKKQNLLLR